MKNGFLFLILFFSHFSLFAEREEVYLSRKDGTVIQGYFDKPEGEGDVPVVVFIDGSFENSVIVNHDKLAARLNPRNIGIISLEKRGITPDGVDKSEFLAHDCFEERLEDYSLLLQQLNDQKIKGCNGHVILLGGSEGGKIAPRLSTSFPSLVKGLVLIGSGGGLSFLEEMKYQSKQLIEQMNPFKRLFYKADKMLEPKIVAKMFASPDSLEMYGPKTWKWCVSYLRYDILPDLLKIDRPIYMIHGEKDIMVPIQSADLIQEAFDGASKTNLQYARYDDLGHALTGREDVYAPMLDWIENKIR